MNKEKFVHLFFENQKEFRQFKLMAKEYSPKFGRPDGTRGWKLPKHEYLPDFYRTVNLFGGRVIE